MSLLAVTSGDIASGVVPAEGVDFDGVSDYLSRSTDLVGNIDSKTFTFSAWVYKENDVTVKIFDNSNWHFYVELDNSENVRILGMNATDTTVLNVITSNARSNLKTFKHILVSIDLANTANRSIYINDELCTATWTTYINDTIDHTTVLHTIGVANTLSNFFKGRLSNLYLDYTYRDLSIEANRRLFITADGKPTPTATLKALNPILYLPMTSNATAHINEGTGGNFTLNGTIATSERGANQDNCVASYFDGTADYLSKSTIVIPNKTRLTVCFSISGAFAAQSAGFLQILDSISDLYPSINFTATTKTIGYNQRATSADLPAYVSSSTLPFLLSSKSTHVLFDIDISNPNNTNIYVDGNIVTKTVTLNTYSIPDVSVLSAIRLMGVYNGTTTVYSRGNIGELYINFTDTSMLSDGNPFWDKDTNKPKSVRQVIKDTGLTPLIAMPLDASNAGKNYGTGGDFTANSAPYVGARGASEFWARSAKFPNSTHAEQNFMSKNIPSSNTKKLSIVLCFYVFDISSMQTLIGKNVSAECRIRVNTVGAVSIVWKNSALADTLNVYTNQGISINSWNSVMFSIDRDNNTLAFFVNGVQSYTTYLNTPSETLLLDNYYGIGANVNTTLTAGYDTLNGYNALCYFTTDYIDFSQEVNRLKFVDAFNMPLDLASQIDKGIIPKPLIYLPFDDPTNLGKNLGTGGAFSVVGTVTQGSDVLG